MAREDRTELAAHAQQDATLISASNRCDHMEIFAVLFIQVICDVKVVTLVPVKFGYTKSGILGVRPVALSF